MRVFLTFSLFVLIAAFAGCSSAYDVAGKPIRTFSNPPKKILIATITTHTRLNNFPSHFSSLDQELQSNLSACGLQTDNVTVFMPELLELSLGNPAKSALQEIKDHAATDQASGILQIDDTVITHTNDLTIANVQLIQLPGYELLWHGAIKKNKWDMSIGVSAHGKALADDITGQMKIDGILQGCPSLP